MSPSGPSRAVAEKLFLKPLPFRGGVGVGLNVADRCATPTPYPSPSREREGLLVVP
jgi:hypothetical protein